MLRMTKILNNPQWYWSIVIWFLNTKKISNIPPVFHNGKVISDFKEKTNQSI